MVNSCSWDQLMDCLVQTISIIKLEYCPVSSHASHTADTSERPGAADKKHSVAAHHMSTVLQQKTTLHLWRDPPDYKWYFPEFYHQPGLEDTETFSHWPNYQVQRDPRSIRAPGWKDRSACPKANYIKREQPFPHHGRGWGRGSSSRTWLISRSAYFSKSCWHCFSDGHWLQTTGFQHNAILKASRGAYDSLHWKFIVNHGLWLAAKSCKKRLQAPFPLTSIPQSTFFPFYSDRENNIWHSTIK